MAVFYAPETAHAKEMWKWDHLITETHPHDGSIRGMRPVGYQEFPKMLYRAGRVNDGPIGIQEHHTVTSEVEQRNMESRGFHARQEDALAAVRAAQVEAATLAAERHFAERRMSEAARAEVAAHEDETDEHVASIPERPIRRRRRRSKISAAPTPVGVSNAE